MTHENRCEPLVPNETRADTEMWEVNKIMRNLGLLQEPCINPVSVNIAYTDWQLSRLAKMLWSIRRIRTQMMGSAFFGEPSWDILLDLFFRQVQKQPVYVKGACLSADAPMTTALRWVDALASKGWIARSADTADRRRQTIHLTASGVVMMRECLGAIAQLLNTFHMEDPESAPRYL